jgi:hypothetical protein
VPASPLQACQPKYLSSSVRGCSTATFWPPPRLSNCCPGSCSLQVGHFWLTHALAFAPRHGSALYIDVRLVTHCSDTCTVRGAQSELEGRYGEGLLPQLGLSIL